MGENGLEQQAAGGKLRKAVVNHSLPVDVETGASGIIGDEEASLQEGDCS